jgi:nicotinate-nucleotide pyrophosphorylase (carboxylating)
MPLAARFNSITAHADFRHWLKLAWQEDVGAGDITSQLLITEEAMATLHFQSRQAMTIAGLRLIEIVLEQCLPQYRFDTTYHHTDGEHLSQPDSLATVRGNARALLTAERLMLNLLQRCCGVATLTTTYVKAVEGTGVQILDTRKTMPSLRQLDKYAVSCGGGHNHRMGLDDRILIKDNHIAVCGSIEAAVARAVAGNNNTPKLFQDLDFPAQGAARSVGFGVQSPQRTKCKEHRLLIEVECDTLDQVKAALTAPIDWILLDNMPPALLQKAVALRGNHPVKLEASGGVSLKTIRAIAETGVDAISVGALTHSAPAVDIGLDIEIL